MMKFQTDKMMTNVSQQNKFSETVKTAISHQNECFTINIMSRWIQVDKIINNTNGI